MNTKYEPQVLEKKWQEFWTKKKIYSPNLDKAKKPFYNLMMFPYPSAEGMHVGNMYAFTGADVYGRFQRMNGKDVFEPIGLDGFGIHSENYAIKVGKHPVEQAKISEINFYKQLKSIGNGFDWDRTVETYKPEYYKWTQWLFIQLFKAGLAYRKKAPVNFCPSCKTVLADEQVLDGKCERCNSLVEKRDLEQWFFRITKYSDRLLSNLSKIDWSEKIKTAQRLWIGKSEGAVIKFDLVDIPGQENGKHSVEVFTTRPDTLYGATFLTISPELAKKWLDVGWKASDKIREYVQTSLKNRKNLDLEKEKTGVFSEIYAINPVNQEKISVWVSDYVLSDYGTGAIMGVPAHDERDHEFAIKFKLPIRKVIDPHNEFRSLVMKESVDEEKFITEVQENHMWVFEYYDWGLIVAGRNDQQDQYIKIIQNYLKDNSWYADADGTLKAVIFKDKVFKLPDENKQAYQHGKENGIPDKQLDWQSEKNYSYCFTGQGTIINSAQWNGLKVPMQMDRVLESIEEKNYGMRKANYHLRDWLISRQRYWGPPIPMIFCEHCDWQPVPEKDLPVKLPFIKDYKPLGTGQAPLASHPEFYKTKCPNCGKDAKRETDVSDTFLDSAWYFLRYVSTDIVSNAFDAERVKKWLPVNMYIGGAEHSVLHLLYARFITMALYDLKLIDFEEPFTKFRAHGLIIKDGAKMSKSKGNVVIPDEYIRKFGADTLRTYLMFAGPYAQGGDFRDTGIEGMHRFLSRVFRLASENLKFKINNEKLSPEALLVMHKSIKKVTQDIENLNYNTAIASLMEWYNFLSNQRSISKEELEVFLKLLSPFAPFISEELYQLLNTEKEYSSIHTSSWPQHDPKFLEISKFTIIVQINGKLRGNILIDKELAKSQVKVEDLAKKDPNVARHLSQKNIKKTIYVEGKVINFVVN